MGLLTKILLAPVRGPAAAPIWIAAKLSEAAEDELYDPATIKRTLAHLERLLVAGDLDEAAYEAEEAVLLDRLAKGRAR